MVGLRMLTVGGCACIWFLSLAACKSLDPTGGGEPRSAPTRTTNACEIDSVLVPEGAQLPAQDGCNTCVCRSGELGCTSATCPRAALPSGCLAGPVVLGIGRIVEQIGGGRCTCTATGLRCEETAAARRSGKTTSNPSAPTQSRGAPLETAGHGDDRSAPLQPDRRGGGSMDAPSGHGGGAQLAASAPPERARRTAGGQAAPRAARVSVRTFDEARDAGMDEREIPWPDPGCDAGAVRAAPGERFRAADGCNTCVCEPPTWRCTRRACASRGEVNAGCVEGPVALPIGARLSGSSAGWRCVCLSAELRCTAS